MKYRSPLCRFLLLLSIVAGALTTAVRDGDQWVLNGSKVWTTGAWWSDWGLCLARTNWDVPKHRGLSVFMFPKNPYLPVIGVVGDVSEGSVRDNPQPTIFYSQDEARENAMTLVLRARDADSLTRTAVAADR